MGREEVGGKKGQNWGGETAGANNSSRGGGSLRGRGGFGVSEAPEGQDLQGRVPTQVKKGGKPVDMISMRGKLHGMEIS